MCPPCEPISNSLRTGKVPALPGLTCYSPALLFLTRCCGPAPLSSEAVCLGPASWTILDDPSSVGSSQSIIVWSQSDTGLLSIPLDLDAALGHVSAIEFLHCLFGLVLLGLDLHNEHKCRLLSPSWLTRWSGNLLVALWSSLFLLGCPSEDIWAAFGATVS